MILESYLNDWIMKRVNPFRMNHSPILLLQSSKPWYKPRPAVVHSNRPHDYLLAISSVLTQIKRERRNVDDGNGRFQSDGGWADMVIISGNENIKQPHYADDYCPNEGRSLEPPPPSPRPSINGSFELMCNNSATTAAAPICGRNEFHYELVII